MHRNLLGNDIYLYKEIHSKKMTSHKYILNTSKIQKLSLKSAFFSRGKYNLDLKK